MNQTASIFWSRGSYVS